MYAPIALTQIHVVHSVPVIHTIPFHNPPCDVADGPFLIDGKPTTPSNADFDRSLRSRDPSWGLRDIDELDRAAVPFELKRCALDEMPSNNFFAVYKKVGGIAY